MAFTQGSVIEVRFTANEELDITQIPSTVRFTSSRGPIFSIPTSLPSDAYGYDAIANNEFFVIIDTNNYNFLAGYSNATVSAFTQAPDLAGNVGIVDPNDANNTFVIEDFSIKISLQKVYVESPFELKLVFSDEIDIAYGEDPSNYSVVYADDNAPEIVPNPKTVSVISSKVEDNVVTLTTSEQTPNVRYSVNYNVIAKKE
jgi:hypothetical protein